MSQRPPEARLAIPEAGELLPPEPSAEAVRARVRAVARFLRRMLPLCQAHTVEFFTRGLWEKMVALPAEAVVEALSGERLQQLLEEPPPQCPLQESADGCDFSNIFCENSQKLVNVRAFALAAKYYSMPNLGVCTSLEDMLKALNRQQQPKSDVEMKTDDFMNNKKSHEVQLMSTLVDGIAKYNGLNQVIDLGSGKGYLSSFLSMQYNLKVYGIDSSNTNTHGANERNRKLKKHWRAYQNQDCVMVGLHTCGDLAPSTLRIFTAKPEIKAVCSVGCCYHLLSEEHETEKGDIQGAWGFPMCQYLKEDVCFCGRNARMAACLALERVAVGQVLPTESLFYRAVLQVIIEEFYGINRSDRNIGKVFSKSSSFLDYVRKSLKKLELDESKISDSLIMEYFGKFKHRMNELEAFNMLKVVLGPCIEALILLDRLCYLTEQDNLAWSGLVKLFDPIKSPRCYAVVAMKKQTFHTQQNC
ncbi:putative methyltransferase-like protein 25 isoform X3 [Paroedura picta]|uniref:putative methyltransferase-like protein 25 isoform X3 n=1 Tax=Paroedura picta TaxID=143630 RepID=UPI004055BC39